MNHEFNALFNMLIHCNQPHNNSPECVCSFHSWISPCTNCGWRIVQCHSVCTFPLIYVQKSDYHGGHVTTVTTSFTISIVTSMQCHHHEQKCSSLSLSASPIDINIYVQCTYMWVSKRIQIECKNYLAYPSLYVGSVATSITL